jgi:PAS domain S-box-containing protein
MSCSHPPLSAAHDRPPCQERLMNEAVLNAAFDSVITIDEEGRVVDLNRAAEELFGFSRSVALGRSLAEMIIPLGLRPACSSGLQRVLSGGPSNLAGQRRLSPRKQRLLVRWLRRTANRERSRDPFHRRREVFLLGRVAVARAELREIAVLVEDATNVDT